MKSKLILFGAFCLLSQALENYNPTPKDLKSHVENPMFTGNPMETEDTPQCETCSSEDKPPNKFSYNYYTPEPYTEYPDNTNVIDPPLMPLPDELTVEPTKTIRRSRGSIKSFALNSGIGFRQ